MELMTMANMTSGNINLVRSAAGAVVKYDLLIPCGRRPVVL